MPSTGIPSDIPVSRSTDIPSQQWIRSSTLARDPPRLHFCEVGFKETDLVLPVYAWRVRGRLHHAEVIPHFSCVDGCGSLRNQLGSSHGLSIPIRSAIERNLGTLVATRVCGILYDGERLT